MVLKTWKRFYFVYIQLHIFSMEKHDLSYAKGTVEIYILCEYAMQRSIYVYIEEYIRVPMKEG